MEELKLMIPTYNRSFKFGEFGGPEVPVMVQPADGLRIVLGTHDHDDRDKPDVQIERHHNGWMIFLHPMAGCDASGYVFFLDDGRSYVAKEYGAGHDHAIEVVDYQKAIAEIDAIKDMGFSSVAAIFEVPCVETKTELTMTRHCQAARIWFSLREKR